MPFVAAIATAISTALSTVVVAGLTVGQLIAIGSAIIGGINARSQKRKAERAARDAFNASLRDRLEQVRSQIADRDMVLGRVRKAGAYTFFDTEGPNKDALHAVITLAGHECDAIEKVWFGEDEITIGPGGEVTSAPYAKQRVESWHTATVSLSSGTLVYNIPVPGYVSGSAAAYLFNASMAEGAGSRDGVAQNAMTIPPRGNSGALPQFSFSVSGEVCTVTFTSPPITGTYVAVAYDRLFVETRAWVHKYLGAPGEDFSPWLRAVFPSKWTAAHQQSGCCKLHVVFLYDPDVYPNSAPAVTALVRGAKVYDPRTATTAWSENPALLIRHVATHPKYGKQPASSINDASIIAAANACDQSVTYTVGGVPETRKLYTAGTVVRWGSRPIDAIGELAEAMAGKYLVTAGQLHVKAGVYTAPVMDLTEDDVLDLDELEVVAMQPRESTYNTVTGTFADPAQQYNIATFPKIAPSAYITQDGAELPTDVEFTAINHLGQTQHVAGVMLRDSRQALTISASFGLRAYVLEPFDVVTITSQTLGWSAKTFEVMQRSWSLAGLIRLTLKETAAAVYSMDAGFSAGDITPNSNLPRFWEFAGTGPISVESGEDLLVLGPGGSWISRMRVEWEPIEDRSVSQSGSVEVAYIIDDQDTGGVWPSVVVDGNATEAYISGVADGARYRVRTRTFNGVAWGAWGAQQGHVVVGKSTPPPRPDEFRVRAMPDGTRLLEGGYTSTVRPVDFAGWHIRVLQGAGPYTWDQMRPFDTDQGYFPALPVETNSLSAGTWSLALAGVDTSGNRSEPLMIVGVLPDPRMGDALLYYSLEELGWPVTATNAVVEYWGSRQVVRAADQATWDDLATWEAWTRWVFNPVASWSVQTATDDLGAVVATLPVVDLGGVGAFTIEEQHSTDGTTWSAWSAISAPVLGRYFRVRVTVSATGPTGPGVTQLTYLDSFRVVYTGSVTTESFDNINPTALTGPYRIGVGDIRLPIERSYATIRVDEAVVQSSSSGAWTFVVVDKDTTVGPRLRFYNAGTLADPPLFDATVRGIAL